MFIKNYRRTTSGGGISLVEAILYVAMLAILFVAAVIFVINIMQGFLGFRIKDEVIANGPTALREIMLTTQQARKIYEPTSAFEVSSGQLSIQTALGAQADDNITYIDFYIDNGMLYEKREGQSPVPLLSPRLRASSFLVHLVSSSAQIELTVQSKISRPGLGIYSQTFISSATPRGY